MNKKRYTNQEIDEKLSNKNMEIERLEDYVNFHYKMNWRCKLKGCGYVWKTSFNSIYSNNGCPKCSNMSKHTNETVDLKLKENGRKIKRLDDVIDAITSMTWECIDCKYIWKTTINKLLNKKTGCPRCSNCVKLTNGIVDERLKNKNTPITRIGDVRGCDNKIKWRCNTNAKHIWETSPDCIYNERTGCPICKTSKGEKEIINILNKLNLKFNPNVGRISFDDCVNPKSGRKLKFDFCIYDGNIIKCLIEYDGTDHFLPLKNQESRHPSRFNKNKYEKIKYRDNIKNQYCESKGIKLIRIPYWNFKNIENILIMELKLVL